MPVFIYRKVRMFGLNGKVYFNNTPIKTGMVKIGVNGDSFALFDHSGFISLGSKSSKIVFEGPTRIALNTVIRVPAGELHFGKYARIGTGTKVVCNGDKIYIGAFSGITFGCTIMNSSFHYTYDSNRKGYRTRTMPIYIGAYNWIGNQTTILGGCHTKDYTIVGTGSLLNHDYSKLDGEYQTLAGRPAKIVNLGIKRVFSPEVEVRVNELFRDNSVNFVSSEEFEDHPENLIEEM